MAQTRAVAVYRAPKEARDDIEGLRAQVMEVLPSRVDPERFLRVAASAVVSNSKVMECSRVSILSAILTAAQLGLEPSGLLGSAYIVPYRTKNGMTAQLIPGYRGLIDLARRSGEIDAIWAHPVQAKDDFTVVMGSEPNVTHHPFIPNPQDDAEDRDPGPYVGAYMVAVLTGGIRQVEWMTYDQIEQVRTRSKAADNGPWVTDWPEMARKTVVRRGSKYLPLTTDFRRALELDEEAEKGAITVTPTKQGNKAALMLLDRARARVQNGDAGEDDEDLEEAEVVAERDSQPLPDAEPETGTSTTPAKKSRQRPPKAATGDATALCLQENAELDTGKCEKPEGHDGPHGNAAGVWPA